MAKTSASKKVATRRKAPAAKIPKTVIGAVHAVQDKKGLDIVVLDLRKAGGFTDFFVICTGTNPRQITAIADSVEQTLRADFGRAAAPHRRRREVAVDPARLFQLRRAHLQPRVPRLLRARAPLGQRRAARVLRAEPRRAARGDARARVRGVRRAARLALDGCVCPVCWAASCRCPLAPWTSAHITFAIRRDATKARCATSFTRSSTKDADRWRVRWRA
jgi:hypothetical protein